MHYIKRDIQDCVFDSFQRPFITVLLGPRRVGKSTIVQHYREQHPKRSGVVQLNMDQLALRQRCARGELQLIIQEQILSVLKPTDPPQETVWVIIDEAQKCPELFDQLKILYDDFKNTPTAIKFIITGSASLSLHQQCAETLAGRIEIIEIREFSLREIASLQYQVNIPHLHLLDQLIANPHEPTLIRNALEQLSPYKPMLEKALAHQLCFGGLPEVVAMSPRIQEQLSYLNNYLQTYLEKDVRAIEDVSNLHLYQQLMEMLAAQTGSIRDDQKLLQSLGCSRETLKKYKGYLSATLVYQDIYPFIHSTFKRLTKSPKGFLLNNGLISILTGIHEFEILQKTGLLGHRFENWFLQAINLCKDHWPSTHTRIDYWRTTGGAEVDFILDRKTTVLPFEVTLSRHQDRHKIKHLLQFMQHEPRATQGFYIYQGPYDYDPLTRIHSIPAWSFS